VKMDENVDSPPPLTTALRAAAAAAPAGRKWAVLAAEVASAAAEPGGRESVGEEALELVDLFTDEAAVTTSSSPPPSLLTAPGVYADMCAAVRTLTGSSPRAALAQYQLYACDGDTTPSQLLLLLEGMGAALLLRPADLPAASPSRPFRASAYQEACRSAAVAVETLQRGRWARGKPADVVRAELAAAPLAAAAALTLAAHMLPPESPFAAAVGPQRAVLLGVCARWAEVESGAEGGEGEGEGAGEGASSSPPPHHHRALPASLLRRAIAASARIDCASLLQIFWAGSSGLLKGGGDPDLLPSESGPTEERVVRQCFPPPRPLRKKRGADAAADAEPALPAPLSSVMAGAKDRMRAEGGMTEEDEADEEEDRREVAAEAAERRSAMAALLLAALDGVEDEGGSETAGPAMPHYTTGLLALYQNDVLGGGGGSAAAASSAAAVATATTSGPVRSLIPTVLHPTLLLTWAVAPLDIAMAEASMAAASAAQHVAEMGADGGRPTTSSSSSSSHFPSPARQAARGLGGTALRVLRRLVASAPPGCLDVPGSDAYDAWARSADGEGDEGGGVSDPSAPPPAPPPPQLRLLQSLVTFIVHCPDVSERTSAYGALQSYVSAFAPAARLWLLSRVLESCPYPNLAGLLLDRVRADVAAAAKGGPAGSGSGSGAGTFLSPRVGELLMSVAHARLKEGLLAPGGEKAALARMRRRLKEGKAVQAGAAGGGGDDDGGYGDAGPTPAQLEDPRTARAVGRHLEANADVDGALLSLLRLLLLLLPRPAAAAGTSTAAILRRDQLQLLRDSYVRPLMRAVMRAETVLREDEGILTLHAHPAAFAAPAAGATQGGGEEATVGGGRVAAAGPPPQYARAATLSKLFLLDAALTPVLDLLEDAAR
jgi:hypothetical protein